MATSSHGLRFHDLRHNCAAILIAADAHPKAIQEHLGHRDIQTTFNVYGHLLPSAQDARPACGWTERRERDPIQPKTPP